MNNFENKDYKIFEIFDKNWALVSAGNVNDNNACTISWGSMGTLWGKQIVTVYLHPSRYTQGYLENNEYFTVSFFDEEYKPALAYMGSHSGRDEDKTINANLTTIEVNNSISYKQAHTTFICKKLYGGMFNKEGLSKEIKDFYINSPKAFPLDENNNWNPHYIYVGEIIKVINNK